MVIEKLRSHLVVPKHKIKKNPAKLGAAVYDILSKEQPMQTVEETMEAMTPKYFEQLMQAIEKGCKDFKPPFYVIVQRKKETIGGSVVNVLKHQYITRQTRPYANFLRSEWPNADHDLYEINADKGTITLVYTLPNAQDSKTILKNAECYDPQLVQWIKDYDQGKIDLDNNSTL